MASTLSPVTIVSDNPKYPQNKVEVLVDNDLSSNTTFVVPNTTFPFIVEFSNCPSAQGKRYISERFFTQLSSPVSGSYLTDRGKIFSTLQKDFTIFPYLKLDYEIFINKVAEIRQKTIKELDKNLNELEYYGASIDSFESIQPDYLLKWLDLPLVDSTNQPIKSFPFLLGFKNKKELSIDILLQERKKLDFFATTYFVTITYPDSSITQTLAEEGYDKYVDGKNLFDGETSKKSKYDSIRNKSKTKSISNILSGIDKIKGTVLAGASLIEAALALKAKLSKTSLPTEAIPKKRIPNFAQNLVKRKTKKAEQKPRKRKKLSSKKRKFPTTLVTTVTPAVAALKKRAGSLKTTAQKQKDIALSKQQALIPSTNDLNPTTPNVVVYNITSRVDGDTIFLTVSNNFGFPSFSQQYSAVTFTQDSAKDNIKFQLDNFGYYDSLNGSYPKTGSPIPS